MFSGAKQKFRFFLKTFLGMKLTTGARVFKNLEIKINIFIIFSYFSGRLSFVMSTTPVKSVLCSVPGSSKSVVDRGSREGLVIFFAIA